MRKSVFTLYSRLSVQAICCLLMAGALSSAKRVSAEVWPNDITEAQVLALAQQKQFQGSGKVSVVGSSGSGVAIAPGWVLTAAHVVGGRPAASFTLDGVTYNGVPRTTNGTPFESSDVALIELNANSQLPASTVFIAPNSNLNPVGSLIWKAGRGQSGTLAQSNANPRQLQPADDNVRAGTNIATQRRNDFNSIVGVTDLIVFQREPSGPNVTDFEVTTAPGDSGGAMYYQHNNQWYIAGTTVGAQGGVGFIDADVSSVYDWIESETGLSFTPQAAPTELTFDSDFTLPGVQDASVSGFGKIWDTTRPMFTGGADDFNYTWENDFAPVAVFGTATTEPQVVQVQSDITFGGIRFDATSSSGNPGPFQLTNGGGSLRASSGGATIETNRISAISAALSGSGTQNITKTGDAELILNGNDNSGFDAQITVADGTLRINNDSALGTGGFTANTKTTVVNGATLQLSGSGLAVNEHMHINGPGHNGNGAIEINVGQHTLTERIAVRSASSLNVAAGASLTVGGDNGRFYGPAGETPLLTQSGDGLVVYDNVSNIAGLNVDEGVAAGIGGLNGTLTIGAGAELRPGDNVILDAIGQFQSGDFNLADGALLTIDIDPVTNTADLLSVAGTLNLAGILELNLNSAPTLGQSFLIIDNDLTDIADGVFGNTGWLTATSGGEEYYFSVDYTSGTGNDVALIAALLGDFDFDGDVDAYDVDLLSANLGLAVGDAANPGMDLDEDGTITLADHDQHVTTLVMDANGTGALIGDLNLDGDVDISQIAIGPGGVQNFGDASVLLASLGQTSGQLYGDGDLNGDGDVDVSQIVVGPGGIRNLGDASRLLANLGQTTAAAAATSAVPEPGSLTVLAITGMGAFMRRRRIM